MKLSRRLILYLLSGTLLYFLPEFCRLQTDGFSIARITSELPDRFHWDNPPLAKEDATELTQALDQSYTYLGCGGQCFAFASQDGRYVIKFFKTRFQKPFSYLLTERKLAKANYKLTRDFNSYSYAFEDLKEETGLLYLHLEKTLHLQKTLHIRDKLGIEHAIDLDRYEFAVQRKAELAFDHFDHLIQAKDFEAAKESLRSLLEITLLRCRKGYYDEDAKIHRNVGFIQNRAYIIDIGRFVKDPSRAEPEVYQKDLISVADQLRKYIEANHPTLTPYFDEMLQDTLKM